MKTKFLPNRLTLQVHITVLSILLVVCLPHLLGAFLPFIQLSVQSSKNRAQPGRSQTPRHSCRSSIAVHPLPFSAVVIKTPVALPSISFASRLVKGRASGRKVECIHRAAETNSLSTRAPSLPTPYPYISRRMYYVLA